MRGAGCESLSSPQAASWPLGPREPVKFGTISSAERQPLGPQRTGTTAKVEEDPLTSFLWEPCPHLFLDRDPDHDFRLIYGSPGRITVMVGLINVVLAAAFQPLLLTPAMALLASC